MKQDGKNYMYDTQLPEVNNSPVKKSTCSGQQSYGVTGTLTYTHRQELALGYFLARKYEAVTFSTFLALGSGISVLQRDQ